MALHSSFIFMGKVLIALLFSISFPYSFVLAQGSTGKESIKPESSKSLPETKKPSNAGRGVKPSRRTHRGFVITEEELRAEYDSLPEHKRMAGILGQEIVLTVSRPELSSAVKFRAGDLITQLKKNGSVVSKELFADFARRYSENPVTGEMGGALPELVRKNPQNPGDPYQMLLDMKPGEITPPIKYQGRYFILRRGDNVPKTYDDARKELEAIIRKRRLSQKSRR